MGGNYKWLKQDTNWLAWEGGLNVDGDGAPNCYGPPGTNSLDYLANAGKPGNWYGIVTDAQGNPVVQGPNDPFPGMYVSPTALQNPAKAKSDPLRYVDSSKIQYISVPRNAIKDYGVKLGDVGFVYCRQTGHFATVIVADVGPKDKWGEGSIALNRVLGLPSSPKNGGTDGGVVVCIFKGTGRGWPRENTDIAQQVQDRLNALGGTAFYQSLVG